MKKDLSKSGKIAAAAISAFVTVAIVISVMYIMKHTKQETYSSTTTVCAAVGNTFGAAVDSDGGLWLWGTNDKGAVEPYKAADGIVYVSARENTAAAVRNDGAVLVRDFSLDSGFSAVETDAFAVRAEVGIGYIAVIDDKKRLLMISADGQSRTVLEGVHSFSAGEGHYAAVTADGGLWTAGSNEFGQLGTGDTEDRTEPVKVMESVKTASAGTSHTVAVTESGEIWTFGSNTDGQLGIGDTAMSTLPVKVTDKMQTAEAGDFYTAAVNDNGELWMWGTSAEALFGDRRGAAAKHNKTADNIKEVTSGGAAVAAITENGDLLMWGDNYGGQISPHMERFVPEPVRVHYLDEEY